MIVKLLLNHNYGRWFKKSREIAGGAVITEGGLTAFFIGGEDMEKTREKVIARMMRCDRNEVRVVAIVDKYMASVMRCYNFRPTQISGIVGAIRGFAAADNGTSYRYC